MAVSELYFNGTFLTMDDSSNVEAILVQDGRIVKTGSKETVFGCKQPDTVEIDLKGKTMMPGFIDGHSHFSGFANSLSQCDLSESVCFDDIVAKIKSFIEENQIPEGQWVTATNYDHNFLNEKCHPNKELLDKISRNHPIVIIHASSHMGVANTLALNLLKIDEETVDPSGGRYGRFKNSREPDGYMEENAFVDFRNHMPMPEVEDILNLFDRAQKIYASYGITTIQEGMVTDALFQILQEAVEKKKLFLDLIAYVDLENSAEILREHDEFLNQYRNHFKIGGYKIFLDGSPQGRTAWMKKAYENAEDGYSGYPIKTDEQLYNLILTALKDGQQLLAHCNGDAAAEQYLTQFEKVKKEHPEYDTQRPVMVHAQFVQKQQLERMKALSMIPSFFIAHIFYWGDIHIQNTGMERAKNISPAFSAVKLGLPFSFHQDSPVLKPDIFETVCCAVKRVTKNDVQLAKEERISVYEALKANTVYAAYQYGEENIKGTITEGKIADLIVLDRNPLETAIDELKDIKILSTIKNGKKVI